MNAGLTNTSVLVLAIDPAAPATLYAGTLDGGGVGGGVFKSTDGGGNWRAINTGLTSSSVFALAIDPSAPATLYAGTGTDGVFKSTNGGGNWSAVNTGLTDTSVGALAIDPSAPATLYAGTSGGGVFKSTNAGGSWTAMNAGLTNPTVNDLAIEPSMTARIYAGTGSGVFEYLKAAEPCVPGATTLCLSGGRFRVTTEWSMPDGHSGSGRAVAMTGDAGYFTFFNPSNVEVAVKVLNGCGFNGNFWVFAAGLTDVKVVMTVFDSRTGDVKTYTNPQGTPFQPIQDTDAFETCAAGATGGARPYDGSAAKQRSQPSVVESVDERAGEPCVPNATTLCLNNSRYQARAQWTTTDGASGAGRVINLTGETGAFWFFSPSNVEIVVKVLNGCGLNSHYWTFAGGLTDVNVVLTVTDTQTGGGEDLYQSPGNSLRADPGHERICDMSVEERLVQGRKAQSTVCAARLRGAATKRTIPSPSTSKRASSVFGLLPDRPCALGFGVGFGLSGGVTPPLGTLSARATSGRRTRLSGRAVSRRERARTGRRTRPLRAAAPEAARTPGRAPSASSACRRRAPSH